MKPSNVQIKRIEKWIERRLHYLSYPDMTEESIEEIGQAFTTL
jgi:hypothetical protein